MNSEQISDLEADGFLWGCDAALTLWRLTTPIGVVPHP